MPVLDLTEDELAVVIAALDRDRYPRAPRLPRGSGEARSEIDAAAGRTAAAAAASHTHARHAEIACG